MTDTLCTTPTLWAAQLRRAAFGSSLDHLWRWAAQLRRAAFGLSLDHLCIGESATIIKVEVDSLTSVNKAITRSIPTARFFISFQFFSIVSMNN